MKHTQILIAFTFLVAITTCSASAQGDQEVEWNIVLQCEGETADNEEDFAMLEISRGNNLPSQCYVVQGLNGVLTLLAIPQGRLLIFDRVED